jgi:hypothetical protein
MTSVLLTRSNPDSALRAASPFTEEHRISDASRETRAHSWPHGSLGEAPLRPAQIGRVEATAACICAPQAPPTVLAHVGEVTG